jgi:hypothetical protein
MTHLASKICFYGIICVASTWFHSLFLSYLDCPYMLPSVFSNAYYGFDLVEPERRYIMYGARCISVIKSGSHQDLLDRLLLLTRKLLNQRFLSVKLKSSLRKFYGRHNDLVSRYGTSVSQMTTDMFHQHKKGKRTNNNLQNIAHKN